MNANQPRQPPGTPAGGRFVATSHQRPSSELEDDRPWSWETIEEEIGPRAASELYERSGGSVGSALAIAAAELSRIHGPEASAEFLRREAERCPTCEGAGMVPDLSTLRDQSFPSLAEDKVCETCKGRGRLPLG